jgi:hypothetical protein
MISAFFCLAIIAAVSIAYAQYLEKSMGTRIVFMV